MSPQMCYGHTTRTLYTQRAQDDSTHTHLLQGQEVLGNVDSSSPAHTHTHTRPHPQISEHTHTSQHFTHKPHPHNISLHTKPPEHTALANSTCFQKWFPDTKKKFMDQRNERQ